MRIIIPKWLLYVWLVFVAYTTLADFCKVKSALNLPTTNCTCELR